MKNQDLPILEKGNYEKISTSFMIEGKEVFGKVAEFQKKYNKFDIDSLQNELHDSIVGNYLGFNLINTSKHGFDCKFSENIPVYLESKVASITADRWNATFNDTTLEKAECFKDKKVWVSLSIWNNASDLLFICFGQNEKIGEFLEQRVEECKKIGCRSTQTISLNKLLLEYGFKILAVGVTRESVYETLTLKYKQLRKLLNINDILTLAEYDENILLNT